MTFSQQGLIQFTMKAVDGTAVKADSVNVATNLANGTTSGKADSYWAGTLTIAAGDDATFDFTSLAISAFGASTTLNFASVKQLTVVNTSEHVTLTVEPGASNGWDQFGGMNVDKGGTFATFAPAAGLPVSGTSKTIKVTNNDTVATLAGNTTSGSAAVTGISSTAGLAAGMTVTGTGIPAGAKIASITNGTSLVMTANATTNGTAVSLDFAWPDAIVKVYVAGVLD